MIPKVRVMTMNNIWEVQCDAVEYVEHIWQVIEKCINERKFITYLLIEKMI